MWGTPGSYILQGLLGCELGPDNSSVAVATFALNGEEFMKFDPKAGNWDGDWPEARAISEKWKQHEDAVWREGHFLLSSCPQRLLGHLETGRGNLEWKGEQPLEESDPGISVSPQPHLRTRPLPTASSLASQPPAPTPRPIPHGSRRVFQSPEVTWSPPAHSPPVAVRALGTELEALGLALGLRGCGPGPSLSLTFLRLHPSARRSSHPEFPELTPALPSLHLCHSRSGSTGVTPRDILLVHETLMCPHDASCDLHRRICPSEL